MLTCPRSSLSFHSNAHHHGSLPQQLGMVWDLLLKADPEGPSPHLSRSFTTQISHSHCHASTCVSAAHLGQKIETVEKIVSFPFPAWPRRVARARIFWKSIANRLAWGRASWPTSRGRWRAFPSR